MTPLLWCHDPSLRCAGYGVVTIAEVPEIVEASALLTVPNVGRDGWALERSHDDARCAAELFDWYRATARRHPSIVAVALEVPVGVPMLPSKKRLADGRVITTMLPDTDAAAKLASARMALVLALRAERPDLRPIFVAVSASKEASTGSKVPGRKKKGQTEKPDTKALVREGVRRIYGAAQCDYAMRHLSSAKKREAAYDALSAGLVALRDPGVRRHINHAQQPAAPGGDT